MENQKALSTLLSHLQGKEQDEHQSNTNQFKTVVAFIDDLIQNDFNRLLSILYRVDISEEKLKVRLAESKETKRPAAEIIADLLVEREAEKIRSREKYKGETLK